MSRFYPASTLTGIKIHPVSDYAEAVRRARDWAQTTGLNVAIIAANTGLPVAIIAPDGTLTEPD